jgi:hypothetical protein
MAKTVTIIPKTKYRGKYYTLERYSYNKSILDKDAKKFRSLVYKVLIKNMNNKIHALYTRRPETWLRKK